MDCAKTNDCCATDSEKRVATRTIDVPFGAWSTPVRVQELGIDGNLWLATVRALQGGAVTQARVRAYWGAGYTVATDPSTVPVEAWVAEGLTDSLVGLGLRGDDINFGAQTAGSVYHTRGEPVWLALYGEAGSGTTPMVVSLRAREV